ncbi:hypothetical protein [Streptomyces soliscabiei]|uniref:hypothetical protein n=1 Tax=Streptomyces soliscabiei TaxID=588897 RepID=UPI0029BCF676|nr:hypothetical protein [Streptomyces sp. NY05-11A]MDX2682150.1 hypothetical protein [Streptomyces sp. NY05-11A]
MTDAELDSFVDSMASRLASFDKTALANAKAQVNRASLPPDADLRATYAEYAQSLTWPGFQERVPRFRQVVAKKDPEFAELRMGAFLGLVNQQS